MATTKTRKRANFDYAAQWSEPLTEEMTLPSGKVVLLQPPNLQRMAKLGKIPNHMLPAVEKFILGGMNMLLKEVPGLTESGDKPGSALIKTAELNDYIDAMCVASIVEPTFVFDGEKGGISISAMAGTDKFAIWDWGIGLTDTIAKFRDIRNGQVESVELPSDSTDIRDEAQPVDRIDQPA